MAAFVRAAPGATVTADELRAWCRDRLAPYTTAVRWEVVDAFSLTPRGKRQKLVLREQLTESVL